MVKENKFHDHDHLLGYYSPEREEEFFDTIDAEDKSPLLNENKDSGYKFLLSNKKKLLKNVFHYGPFPIGYLLRVRKQKLLPKELCPKEHVEAFERGRKFIHEKYSSNREKLYDYAIEAFNHMEENHTSRLVEYCSVLKINYSAEAYANFVMKQLDKALEIYYDHSVLSVRYDKEKLSTMEMMLLYKEWGSVAFRRSKKAITQIHKYRTPETIEYHTIHEGEHFFQYRLDGFGNEVGNGNIADVLGGPLYIKALDETKDLFHKSIVYTEYKASKPRNFNNGKIERTIGKILFETKMPEKTFYFEKIIEIISRIRELQGAFAKTNEGDDTLTINKVSEMDKRVQTILKTFEKIVKDGKMEELFDRANNKLF